LGLTEIQAIHGRAEEMARRREHREQYDVVIARAVAPLPTLVEYMLPFARPSGWCIAMKGAEAQAEAERAQKAIATLGGGAATIEPVTLPGVPDRRALVIIRKVRLTPDRYPRASGAPRRSPL
jgi:16S rRNA (guanine527-N7)-methyltransferase